MSGIHACLMRGDRPVEVPVEEMTKDEYFAVARQVVDREGDGALAVAASLHMLAQAIAFELGRRKAHKEPRDFPP